MQGPRLRSEVPGDSGQLDGVLRLRSPFDGLRPRYACPEPVEGLRTNGCRDHGSVLRSRETLVNWMASFDFEMARSFDRTNGCRDHGSSLSAAPRDAQDERLQGPRLRSEVLGDSGQLDGVLRLRDGFRLRSAAPAPVATLRTNGCRDHGSVLRSWETLVNWMVSFDFEMAFDFEMVSFDFEMASSRDGVLRLRLRTNGCRDGSVLRSWETLVRMASFDFARVLRLRLATLRTNGGAIPTPFVLSVARRRRAKSKDAIDGE